MALNLVKGYDDGPCNEDWICYQCFVIINYKSTAELEFLPNDNCCYAIICHVLPVNHIHFSIFLFGLFLLYLISIGHQSRFLQAPSVILSSYFVLHLLPFLAFNHFYISYIGLLSELC